MPAAGITCVDACDLGALETGGSILPPGDSVKDAEETVSTTVVFVDDDDIQIGDATPGNPRLAGFYVDNIIMPQGATCSTFTLAFMGKVGTVENTGTPTLLIKAQDSLTPALFIPQNANISGRPLKAQSVSWSPTAWTAGTVNAASTTPNLCTLVQPFLDDAGWVSPGTIVFRMAQDTGSTGTRTTQSLDFGGTITASYTYSVTGTPTLTLSNARVGLVDVVKNTHWLAAAGAGVTVGVPSCVRLTWELSVTVSDAASQVYTVQYATNGGAYGALTADPTQTVFLGPDLRYAAGEVTTNTFGGGTFTPGSFILAPALQSSQVAIAQNAKSVFSANVCLASGLAPGTFVDVRLASGGTGITGTIPRMVVGNALVFRQ